MEDDKPKYTNFNQLYHDNKELVDKEFELRHIALLESLLEQMVKTKTITIRCMRGAQNRRELDETTHYAETIHALDIGLRQAMRKVRTTNQFSIIQQRISEIKNQIVDKMYTEPELLRRPSSERVLVEKRAGRLADLVEHAMRSLVYNPDYFTDEHGLREDIAEEVKADWENVQRTIRQARNDNELTRIKNSL